MDTLPTELRLKIFGLALRAEVSLYRESDAEYDDSEEEEEDSRLGGEYAPMYEDEDKDGYPKRIIGFDVSLFTVSRQISQEAQDAFWEVNTISIYAESLILSRLKLARHLEFKSEMLACAIGNTSSFSKYVINAFAKLPLLRTITLASDPDYYRGLTLRQRSSNNSSCAAVTVHQIGLFELIPRTPIRGTIWVKDFQLQAALPMAKYVASWHSVTRIWELLLNPPSGRRALASKKTMLLAYWLRCYEDVKASERELPAANNLRDADVRLLRRWVQGGYLNTTCLLSTRALPAQHEQLPDDVWLSDLSLAAGHSPELLTWASELLGYNFHRLWFWMP